jgi:hypothetical protein
MAITTAPMHTTTVANTAIAPSPSPPYTSSFLARGATLMLHTPRPRLTNIFDSSEIAYLSLDPNTPTPDTLTTATCQRLVRILKFPPVDASPATVPLALCLLLRFRMVPARDRSPDPSDEVLIAVSVFIAYKLLFEHDVSVLGWDVHLEMKSKVLVEAERHFLHVLEHRCWIRDEGFVALKGRLDALWNDVYSKAKGPAKPGWLRARLGKIS